MPEEEPNRHVRWDAIRRQARVVRVFGLLLAGLVLTTVAYRLAPTSDPLPVVAVASRGGLTVSLLETGTLKPARSTTYRSPIPGREIEVLFLVPEGTRVRAGDLVARLDSTELEAQLEQARQALRQAGVELRVAEADQVEAESNADSLARGGGLLDVEEAQARHHLAQKNVTRLREEYASLAPLLEKGFITADELRRLAQELDQAELDATVLGRRVAVLVDQRRPRDQQRATAAVVQRAAQVEYARAKLAAAELQVDSLTQAIRACSLYAKQPGLVVLEEYLAGGVRRKVRVGDRVTPSQGLLTIPDLERMVVESSVREGDLHRVRVGLRATIGLDAFPDLRLDGHVASIGTLARASADQPFEEKRFDVSIAVASSCDLLRPEMTARIEIMIAEKRDALLLPVAAVFGADGDTWVYRVVAGRAHRAAVTVGLANDAFVEVLDGLAEGDAVSLVDRTRESTRPTGAIGATGAPPR